VAIGSSFEVARQDFERRFVCAALAHAGGQRHAAAKALGVTRQGLSKMLRRLRIDQPAAGEPGATSPSLKLAGGDRKPG
jgi:DNA-binding NtrC family response regulator